MPEITGDMENHKLTGAYGYSAAKLNTLGATEYTLVTIVNDVSGSVASFKVPMEACLKEIVKSCIRSPRADNLLIRATMFDDKVKEIHGYKQLALCPEDSYDNCLHIGGYTALFDATENGVEATSAYADLLASQDYSANGIVIVITDGADNRSTLSQDGVKKAFEKAVKNEHLESLVTILVGVNDSEPELKKYLEDFKTNAGFRQYISLGDVTEKKLAKLAEFVSKSISAQSQALGTGGPSQALTLV